MTAPVWRIGQLLNSVQSTFVGLLRVWSIPIVLMLSIASGYTTYYGMSHFIGDWISLIVTIGGASVGDYDLVQQALAAGGDEAARAFAAMMTMRKIDVAAIEAARRG